MPYSLLDMQRFAEMHWCRRVGVYCYALVAIYEVALRRARLLLGWVTLCGQINNLAM